jgi:hypothetical protein
MQRLPRLLRAQPPVVIFQKRPSISLISAFCFVPDSVHFDSFSIKQSICYYSYQPPLPSFQQETANMSGKGAKGLAGKGAKVGGDNGSM